MPKRESSYENYFSDLDFTETGNWNSAKIYSEAMITSYLISCSRYERLAKFGVEDVNELWMTPKETITERRIEGLKWIIDALISVIDNSHFALKRKNGDKDKVLNFQKQLEEIEKLLSHAYINKQNYDKQILEIDEAKFKLIFDALRKIKRELLAPLNNADLIFAHKEEFDPQLFKSQVKERLITRG